MTTKYIIKGHSGTETGPNYNWSEEYAGSETAYYDTEEAAEAGIEELRKCGPEFSTADWRVFAEELDDE